MSFRFSTLVFTSMVAVLALQSSARAQTFQELVENAPPIHRVEEDWEMLVVNPDPNFNIPQVVTVFGPTNAAFDTHTVYEMNHGTLPSFGEGGMQLQVWYGDSLIGYQQQKAPTELNIPNEKIRYTTATALVNSYLVMEVKNGTSQSFGTFAEPGILRASLYTQRTDLNPYQPSNSIDNSRVTFGANRVSYFKRTAIRFYDAAGVLYAEENVDRFVHQLN